jgi:ribulose-bisphosphate carboxylase large chain
VGEGVAPLIPTTPVPVSGERFRVVYRVARALAADDSDALARARDIAVEQTVEFPIDLIPPGELRDRVVGRVEGLEPKADGWLTTISYAVESAGGELSQLLNVIFGNYSLKPGVRVERLVLPDALLHRFRGPRFGRDGLRSALGVPRRALLATALKPLGLPTEALAGLAYRLALSGIDVVKDDHGLANQPFAPFAERIPRCAEAVERANRETGGHAIYAPNVTADGEETLRRARQAKTAGAGALLVAPGLVGLGTLARLAGDDEIALPVLSHPAFQGSFVVGPDHGISPGALFGQIARLAGADGSIYPNYGGRFSFSRDECRSIATATTEPLGSLRPVFPVPGGGMRLERVPELLEFYGNDVILLVGGGLFQRGPDLLENVRAFRRMVGE